MLVRFKHGIYDLNSDGFTESVAEQRLSTETTSVSEISQAFSPYLVELGKRVRTELNIEDFNVSNPRSLGFNLLKRKR